MSNGYDYMQLEFVSTRSLTLESTRILKKHDNFSPNNLFPVLLLLYKLNLFLFQDCSSQKAETLAVHTFVTI